MPRANFEHSEFVPWGRTGLSLDLMRRDPSADNGLVELMVASLAERAAVFGVGRVSVELRNVP
jgi:lysyl-tRNA synthetase class 2